jgi:glycosyltransferase involved in cell wall biosynthesis
MLLIAGDGAPVYVKSLVALAQSLGVGSRVVWLGFVDGPRKAAAMALAHVFVLPSFSENFGIAAAEAMLAGLPCLLGRGVAIAREVQDAGAGIAVDPDFRSIAQALAELLVDDARRRELGQRARQFAEQRYSMHAMAERLTNLYQCLANMKGAAST